MDKLRALQYFVSAAEEGSFAGASRRMHVTVPAIQKLINSLEATLGVRLFERTVQGLALTANGQSYLESCQPLLEELAALDDSITRTSQRPTGTLVIGAHSQFAHHVLLPALPRFHARHPEIVVDLRIVQRPTDPDAASVDVFLLMGWPEADDFVVKRLGQTTSFVMAAPEYWRARGVPRHPAELERHDCLVLRNPAGTLIDLWEFQRDEEKLSVTVNGWLSSNARDVVLDAVLAGEGVGRFAQSTTRAHLEAGRLVPVLLEWEVLGGPPINLLYRPNHRRTPRVRVFIDFVTALLDDLSTDGSGARRPGAERPYWHRRGHGRASSLLRRPREQD